GAGDGPGKPLSIYSRAKRYEGAPKELTLWNHLADPLAVLGNRGGWESWSEAGRQIARGAGREARNRQTAIARKGVTPQDPSLLKEIEGHGVTVTSLTQEQHAAFVKATKPVYDKWKSRIGQELVDLAEKSIAARTK